MSLSPNTDFRTVLSNNNRTIEALISGSTDPYGARGVTGYTSGKWRIEYTIVAVALTTDQGRLNVGLVDETATIDTQPDYQGLNDKSIAYFNGGIVGFGSAVTGQTMYGAGDVITLDIDLATSGVVIRKNGTQIASDIWDGRGATVYPFAAVQRINDVSSDKVTLTASTTPPTGYKHWDN
jgi:hypothetical protein